MAHIDGGLTFFSDHSTAGNGTFTNDGAHVTGFNFNGASNLWFSGSSTAANATITNNGGTVVFAMGGVVSFFANATADSATITNNGATALADGGVTNFFGNSTADNATIINNAGTVSGASGGQTFFASEFGGPPTAGNATITNNGGTVAGAGGGQTTFKDTSTAGNSTLIANGGSNGGEGGAIFFEDRSSGGTARVEVFGNGSLDISPHQGGPGLMIASIEGDGSVFLGRINLTVGSNDSSTTFSGVIQDGGEFGGAGGSLTKIGLGTLILSGTNTYTGNTNVNRGVLQLDGSITSSTFLRGGTLAGTGTINANITNIGGTVSPEDAAPGVLTVVHNYTQAQYATLMIQIAGANTGDFSVLNVLGNASLSGFLDPVLLNGFVPAIGQTFTFLNYASLTGEFAHIKHQVFDNGMLEWSVIYEANNAILTVQQHEHVPDQGSTFLLLTLGLLGLVTCRQQLVRRES
jgi:autotransporter-associated beta strand protein